MKTLCLACTLVILATSPARPAAATASNSPSPDPAVPFGTQRIETGMVRAQVRATFGEPTVLARDVWAYFNLQFRTTRGAARCDAMVVRFDADRVAEIRLCESGPLRALIARLEQNKARGKLAAR